MIAPQRLDALCQLSEPANLQQHTQRRTRPGWTGTRASTALRGWPWCKAGTTGTVMGPKGGKAVLGRTSSYVSKGEDHAGPQQKCGLCARHLDTGQRLEGALEVHRRDGGRVQDVCIAEPVGLVEEQQDDHLVRAHVELVPLLPKGRPHVCAADGSSAAARGTQRIQHDSGAAAALEAYQASHMHLQSWSARERRR